MPQNNEDLHSNAPDKADVALLRGPGAIDRRH
jgi:hypothetical protein